MFIPNWYSAIFVGSSLSRELANSISVFDKFGFMA